MNKNQVPYRAFPVLGILGIALVILKAVGVSSLSWVWTLAPFWIGPAVFLAVIGGVSAVSVIAFLFWTLFAFGVSLGRKFCKTRK